jgi:hypothetical protein
MRHASRVVVGFSSLLVATGCGGDESEAETRTNACLTIVDAYASAWDRCGKDTYENANEILVEAMQCDEVREYDAAEVDQCISELEDMSCTSVNISTVPHSCQVALDG